MIIPNYIPIKRVEGYHTDKIGVLRDGRQFLAFEIWHNPEDPPSWRGLVNIVSWRREVRAWRRNVRAYGVVHVFSAAGDHIESHIRCFSSASEAQDLEDAETFVNDQLSELGAEKYCDIRIRFFSLAFDGVDFYFEERIDDGEKSGLIILQPNDLLFHPPWNGRYDT